MAGQAVNELFNVRLAEAGGKEKMNEYGGGFIRDKLREVSFVRKILPPEYVTRNDCQVSEHHDTLVKIVFVEPQSRAMAITFRGSPRTRYIRGPRAATGFFTITSEQFQKTEQELLVYPYPITKVIEENAVKDIQEIEDREFTIHAEGCVQGLQQEANGGVVTTLNATALQGLNPPVEFSVRKGQLARAAAANDAVIRPVQRQDFVEGFKMLSGNRGRCEMVLITETEFDDVGSWTVEDQGDRIQSETTVEGYKYNTLIGRPYVRSIKTDILRRGNMYFFTNANFLGKFFVLNQTKFYIDKVVNMITFQAWEDVAMILLNVSSVRKVELYSADASANDADVLLANFLPLDEDALGAINNRVDAGLVFPQVVPN